MVYYICNMWWGFFGHLFGPPTAFKIGHKTLSWQSRLSTTHFHSLFSLFSNVLKLDLPILLPLFRLMLPPWTPSPFFISTCETCNGHLFLSLKHFFFFWDPLLPGSVHGFLGLNLFLPLEVAMWSKPGQTELLVYFVGFIRRKAFPFCWSDRTANKGSLRELVSIHNSIRKKPVWKHSQYEVNSQDGKTALLWHHLDILEPNAPEAGDPQIFLS